MTNAAHPVAAEEVMAYMDGELAADRAVAVSQHVDGCTECRQLVRDLQAVSRRMGEWGVEACSMQAVGERPVVAKRKRRWLWPVWVGAVAAVVIVGVMVRRPGSPDAVLSELSKMSIDPVKTKPPGRVDNGGSNFAFQSPGRVDGLNESVPATQVAMDSANSDASTAYSYQAPTAFKTRVTPQAAKDFGTRLKAEFKEEPMIARTAQLALITNDFAHARERMEAILKARHGYIGQLTMSSPTGAGRSLEAALKVPSGELDASMGELKKLGRVETESQTGEEVTQQYTDLGARLANSRNAEQRLTAVLQQRTGKMQDVLDVEKEITRVRGEIEQMEAEQKALGKRVEFATINLKISEEYKAQLQAPDSVGTRLGNAAVAGYRHVADGAMGIAEFILEYTLTIAIWMAVLFWPARWAWRRYRTGTAS
jgi:hypothetical protein